MAAIVRAPALRRASTSLLHDVSTASMAGALAGAIVGGVGSRIAMRISGAMSDPALVGIARTDNGNILGDITFVGTAGLVLFAGILPGIIGGAVYLAVRPWLRPFGRWAGLAFGIAALAALASLVLEPFNIDFRKFGSPPVNVILFAALFPLFGVTLGALVSMLERRRAGAVQAWDVLAIVGLALALPAIASFMVASLGSFIAGDRADLRPLSLAYWLVAAAALRWWLSRDGAFSDVRQLSRRDAALSSLVLLVPSLAALPATLDAIRFLARP